MQEPKRLDPYRVVTIDGKSLFAGCFLLAMFFWIIGLSFRYYVPVGV